MAALAAGRGYLASGAGKARVLDAIEDATNGALRGRLEAGRVELDGLGLVFEDVRLYDPDGELVAQIERLEAAPRLLELAGGRLEFDSVKVLRPRLYLVEDEHGLNLTRAVATRPGPPAPPSARPSTFRLDLGRIALEQGYLDFRWKAAKAERRYTLQGLAGTGRVRYASAENALDVQGQLSGRASAPFDAPAQVTATLEGRGDALGGQVSLDLGGARLVARASEQGTEAAEVHVDSLLLPPAEAAALVPGWTVKEPVTAKGELTQAGNVLRLALDAGAGSARLEASGSFDVIRWRTEGLRVSASGVDLSKLYAKGPASSLALELSASGGGTSLAGLSGDIKLDVPASRVGGRPVGPVRLAAHADSGRFQLSLLRASLPGLEVDGTGSGTPEAVHLSGTLEATDLSALAATFGAFAPGEAPLVSGSGKLDFRLEGPPAEPGVSLNGTLASLRLTGLEVAGCALTAEVPNVRKPLEAQAKLTAKRVRVGENAFRDVSAKLATRGRHLEAELSTQGLADLLVRLTGTLDAGGEALDLSTLAVEYPEAHWALSAPSRVSWAGGDTVVDPLALVSGAQSLTVSAEQKGERLRASLEATALDLAMLPRALVAERLGLAGKLSAHVAVDGKLPRPEGEARLKLGDGAVRKLKGVAATLEATYRDDRAVGTLTVASRAVSMDGDFDVPVSALLAGRAERVRATVKLGGVQVAELLAGLEQKPTASGLVTGTVKVEGTAEDPRLDAAFEGRGLSYARAGAPPLEAKRAGLKVASGAASRLGLRLDVEALGGDATLTADTPLTLSRLVKRFPTADEWLDTRGGAELEVRKLDLARAATAELVPVEWTGTLGLRAAASGTVRRPEGNCLATLSGFTAPSLPATDATLKVVAGPAALTATADVTRASRPLVHAVGRLGAPLADAVQAGALGRAALHLTADLGPLGFTEQPLEEGGDEGVKAQTLMGTLEGHFEATGTLDAPKLTLRSTATQLYWGDSPLGKARLAYDYADKKATGSAEFAASDGGGFTAEGRAALDLSLAALRKGLALRTAPFQLDVKAHQFDVTFLSGLNPTVRTLGGKLRADATLGGSYDVPDFKGTFEWNDGRVGLLGYGDYRKVHLLLEATGDRARLVEFVAQSGGGELRATAEAIRSGPTFRLTGEAKATHFPVVYDDQLFAVASFGSSFEGDLSARRVDLRQWVVPEAHIELPEVKRKDLQSLDRPTDIVLTRDGQPIRRRRPKPAGDAATAENAPKRQGAQPRVYSAVLVAPRNVWVKGSDVQVELGLSEGFRLEYAQALQLFGEVRVLRGRADVIGRRFDVQKDSQVRFAGPAATPYVNVNGTYVSEREGVTVTVAISGRGKDLTLKPSSQPPLSESEIYTLLATGRRTLKRDSGATITGAQAASVIGSLAASQLRTVLAKKLPLDVFSIEAGETGLAGTRVEAGTYLSDKVYLGYTGQIGADPAKGENSHEVKLEYQISPRWSFEAKYGDARAGGADLVWSKDY